MPLHPSGQALFAGSAEEFCEMAPASSLTAYLERQFNRRWGTVGPSEVRSWRNSLTALAGVVDDADLPRSGVGVELRLPNNSRRVDACFVARDHEGAPHAVIVELKQWTSAAPSTFPDNVIIGGEEALHPAVQAAAYADYLRAAHSAFTEDDFRLSASCFLHAMPRAFGRGITGVEYEASIADAPLFFAEDHEEFGGFLYDRLAGGDGLELLPHLVAGRYRPSIKLLDAVYDSLKGKPQWVLLDEQRLAYNYVRGYVSRALGSGEKAVVIILGGPGTGKSVIALHLLTTLGRSIGRDLVVSHATASKAFTTNLRALGPRGADALFRWTMDFASPKVQENAVDLLVVDEAHRIRKTSNMRFTKRALRSTMPQAQELIRAARVSAFFLDNRQNVRPDEIGSPEVIAQAAVEEGVPVTRVDLTTQFRCNGSSGYIEWVERLMSPDPAPAGSWLGEEYQLRVASSPEEVERWVRAEAGNGIGARLVAGFCWPWSNPNPDRSLTADVVIGDWRRPWNEKEPKTGVSPAKHPYTLWATTAKGLGEIGCIYSAQGFEFDYCGVILGNDLVWRDTIGWVANRDASHDPQIRRRKLDPDDLQDLIWHTYRVLLTRGIRGTFVYSTDLQTSQFLRALVERAGPSSGVVE